MTLGIVDLNIISHDLQTTNYQEKLPCFNGMYSKNRIGNRNVDSKLPIVFFF